MDDDIVYSPWRHGVFRNFQNQPRGSTFPVRRAIISRFKSGTILEGDFAGLEFRVAGILSKDPNIARDIAEGVDVHTRTANIMSAKGQPTNRQEAKAHTFKPIFGGMSGSPAEQAYYREFLSLYPRLAKWHEELQDEAIKTKKIVSPSGREYAFPRAQRMPWGGSSFATQIKNYEVQGFATGDVVPIACIIVDALLKQHDLKTVLINTVHDSLMLDVYPGEEEIARTVLASGMLHAQKFCEQYYGFEFGIPLDIEMKQGPNALDLEKIDHKKYIVPIDIWAKDTIYTV